MIPSEAATRGVPWKKVSLEISQNEACNFIKKETLAQLFSCEFSETSTNTFFCFREDWQYLNLYIIMAPQLTIICIYRK